VAAPSGAAAALPAPSAERGGERTRRIDRLGVLLCAIGGAGMALMPFLVFKANRIASGAPKGVWEALPPAGAAAFWAAVGGVAAVAVLAASPKARLAASLAGVAALLAAVALGAAHLSPPGDRFARIAPGGGAWLLLLAVGLMATDALARLRPGPLARVLALAAAGAVAALMLKSGLFDSLSVLREYASRAEVFAREARQHVLLAGGSVAAAILAGAPLGAACHRSPRLRAAALPALNIVQTIPSIALFGILMAPLGYLGRAFPLAGDLGVRGIGAAPALVALFLYALLPLTANTALGLRQVSPAAVDAAYGMGMTRWQVLRGVEIPLALPVILTGVRIVLVQNIGLATVAALIGGGGFGTFVFQGVGQTAIDLVLLGAVPTVALAFSAAVLLDAAVDALRKAPA
jgi:osmoprotectant transport system permease protein